MHRPTIYECLTDPALLGRHFEGDSYYRWRVAAKAISGHQLSPEELEIFKYHTGRSAAPRGPFREPTFGVGRGGGKTKFGAGVTVAMAIRDYSPHMTAGERTFALSLAADKRQADLLRRYCLGMLESPSLLPPLVQNVTSEEIQLTNRCSILVRASNYRLVRGGRYCSVVCDEAAFWFDQETSANPAGEVLRAVKPGLARTPGSLLLVISSPFSKSGILWNAFRKYYAKDDDRCFYWKSETRQMNATFDEDEIKRAFEEDPVAAASEYGGEFRQDLENYIATETVEACVGDYEVRAYDARFSYRAFTDVAGGSGSDSYTIAVGHLEGDLVVVDLLLETRPPFNPEEVTARYVDQALRPYRISQVTGDAYAGSWPAAQLQKHGISYEVSARSKSQLYADALPLLNSRRMLLPRNSRLQGQIVSLERRVGRGTGRENIDHPQGSAWHDDCANSVLGLAATLALGGGAKGLGYLAYYKSLYEIEEAKKRPPVAHTEALEEPGSRRDLPLAAQVIRGLWK